MQNPFESVVKACKNDVEEWLYGAVKEAQTIYRSLNAGVIKLNKIHEEVERLSEKQSVKSKIISIDSELRVLSIKLGEFEEKANSRQRLTQKSNSASLLKEEKFRKQMQNEFSSKLKTLWGLLSRWESIEGSKFDEKLLSNEVSLLLENDKIEDWVQRRTAFMHLKTVQQKSTRKHLTPNSSPKRPKTSDSTLSVSSNSIRHKTSNPISSNKRRYITRARSATSQNRNLRKESPAPLSSNDHSFQNNLKVLSPATNHRKTQTQHIISKSTRNSKSDKKYGGNDNTSPPLANNPFGRILAKTPTSEKENFKF
jgi:predicted RNA-binding protein with RPS1 domain